MFDKMTSAIRAKNVEIEERPTKGVVGYPFYVKKKRNKKFY